MAVNKLTFVDETGVQQLSTYLLQSANTRIKERILTSINDAAYTDDKRVLAAKTILEVIGKSTDTKEQNTLYGLIKKLTEEIGTSADLQTSATVYGAIAKAKADVMATISGLTHLTYKTVTGEIDDQVPSPETDVIYLQQDSEEDTTWNLYVWNDTDEEWICVGDTSLTLSNYWSKSETDVNELQAKIMGKIDDATIKAKVTAAFTATDPFAASGDTNAYVS